LYRTGPLVAAIVTVLALASCGGGSSSAGSTDAAGTGGDAKVAATKGGADPKNAPSHTMCVRINGRHAAGSANSCLDGGGAARSGGACEARLSEFLGRMNDLRQALLAGLSYAEYVVRVAAIRDAYEAVPVKKLAVGCLDGAAGDAEDAFNQYLRAANTWGDCAGTAGCAASEIEGKLQRRWRNASQSLDQAKKD
jgi:hypothetical protein